jgi:hypothetical protein
LLGVIIACSQLNLSSYVRLRAYTSHRAEVSSLTIYILHHPSLYQMSKGPSSLSHTTSPVQVTFKLEQHVGGMSTQVAGPSEVPHLRSRSGRHVYPPPPSHQSGTIRRRSCSCATFNTARLAYYFLVTFLTVRLGVAKAIVASRGQAVISHTLDWVAGTLLTIVYVAAASLVSWLITLRRSFSAGFSGSAPA